MTAGFFGMVMVMNRGGGPLSSLTWIKQELDLLIRSNLINVNDAFPSTTALE